jgi:hypothetical protein
MELTNEEKYYEHGFFKSKINSSVKTLLWREIYATNWVKDQGEAVYKSVPDWYYSNVSYDVGFRGSDRKSFERRSGVDFLNQAPQSLKAAADLIAQSQDLSFFKRYYDSYDLMYIDLWNGSEEIPYHFDTINGADTLVLIYLTEELVWSKEWGGQISLQKKIKDVILAEEEIDPISETMVVVNNANPLVKHKVTALKNLDVNRYTVSFNFKWK